VEDYLIGNCYIFRPLTDLHQVIHTIKNVLALQYEMKIQSVEVLFSDKNYIIYDTNANQFHWMYKLVMGSSRPKHVGVSSDVNSYIY
jgi:hypothetical protein